MFTNCICFSTNNSFVFLYSWVVFHHIQILYFLYLFMCWWMYRLLQYLAIINCAVLILSGMVVLLSYDIFNFYRKKFDKIRSWKNAIIVLVSWGIHVLISIMVILVYIQCRWVPFSLPPYYISFFVIFLMICFLTILRWNLKSVLICISLMASFGYFLLLRKNTQYSPLVFKEERFILVHSL